METWESCFVSSLVLYIDRLPVLLWCLIIAVRVHIFVFHFLVSAHTELRTQVEVKCQVEMQLHKDVFHNMGTSENEVIAIVFAPIHNVVTNAAVFCFNHFFYIKNDQQEILTKRKSASLSDFCFPLNNFCYIIHTSIHCSTSCPGWGNSSMFSDVPTSVWMALNSYSTHSYFSLKLQ